MNQFLNIEINYLLEFIITITLVYGFCGQLSAKIINRILIYILPLTLLDSVSEYFLGSDSSIVFINLTILWTFILLSFKDTSLNTLVITLLVFFITMLIQIVLIIGFVAFSLKEGAYIAILGNLLTLIIAFMLSMSRLLRKFYTLISSRPLIMLAFFVNVTSILLILNINHKLYPSQLNVLLVDLILPILIIILVNVIMLNEYLKQKRQENQLITYQTYLPYIEEMIDQVRSRQHKFDNELQTIKSLTSTHKTYDTLTQAIRDYSGYIESSNTNLVLLKINYKFLAALLFKKNHVAENKGISVNLTIPSPLLYSNAPEYELVDIVGVLFDNMVEATPIGSECSIAINSDNVRTTITTINPGPILTPAMRDNFIKKGYTTKLNNNKQHGYGLYQVKEAVEKYDGMLFIENINQNDTMCISISVVI